MCTLATCPQFIGFHTGLLAARGLGCHELPCCNALCKGGTGGPAGCMQTMENRGQACQRLWPFGWCLFDLSLSLCHYLFVLSYLFSPVKVTSTYCGPCVKIDCCPHRNLPCCEADDVVQTTEAPRSHQWTWARSNDWRGILKTACVCGIIPLWGLKTWKAFHMAFILCSLFLR